VVLVVPEAGGVRGFPQLSWDLRIICHFTEVLRCFNHQHMDFTEVLRCFNHQHMGSWEEIS
jgi:hypothetical protein